VLGRLLGRLRGHVGIFAQLGAGRHFPPLGTPRILREHGLLDEQRPDGDRRGRLYRLRPESLDPLAGWLDEVRCFWTGHLEQFRSLVEAEAINVRGWERVTGGAEVGRGYREGAKELLSWYAEAAATA
jgi:hypothetical protein